MSRSLVASTTAAWPPGSASHPWIICRAEKRPSPPWPCCLPFTGSPGSEPKSEEVFHYHSNCTLIYEEMRRSSCVPDVRVDHLALTSRYYCPFFCWVFFFGSPLVSASALLRSLSWMRWMQRWTTATLERWSCRSASLSLCFLFCWHRVLALNPGDQFSPGRVQQQHADHCHFSEGRVFLQGWCFDGGLLCCN